MRGGLAAKAPSLYTTHVVLWERGLDLRLFYAFALLFALAASGAVSAAPDTLDGWGALKFGMSPDQARGVPGFTFGRYGAKNILNQNQGAMASKKPVLANGVPYSLDLNFNAFEVLARITLQNEKPTSQADCRDRFLGLLAQLEKTYGALSPVYAARKKNDQDLLPIAIEWQNGLGASRYQLATVFMGTETAYVWDARKSFDARYVDVSAVWSAPHDDEQAVCLTQMDFKA